VQTNHYVVLNKPAGLPVHAGPKHGPSVEDMFPALSRRRHGPWLAHRLDADTAGCLVIALTKQALLAAQAAFAAGTVDKTYWAIVRGTPPADSGTVTAKLLKKSGPAGWRVVVDAKGQDASTDWRVLASADDLALLEVKPRTGRTHQVRVHCASIGCPVAGDALYGGGAGPLQLLARSISVPVNPVLKATAPFPAHMADAAMAVGYGTIE
jgi:tRNA pseudouridine32 synthase/23S rRNA pseudouridine746 synthase